MLYGEITERILRSFYRVYNRLGYGFLERVYENALSIACCDERLDVKRQVKIDVFFEGSRVGTYQADLIINDVVIVEIKAAESLRPEHEAQLTNYLRATSCEVGLLLNFGKSPETRRKLFTNDRKIRLGTLPQTIDTA